MLVTRGLLTSYVLRAFETWGVRDLLNVWACMRLSVLTHSMYVFVFTHSGWQTIHVLHCRSFWGRKVCIDGMFDDIIMHAQISDDYWCQLMGIGLLLKLRDAIFMNVVYVFILCLPGRFLHRRIGQSFPLGRRSVCLFTFFAYLFIGWSAACSIRMYCCTSNRHMPIHSLYMYMLECKFVKYHSLLTGHTSSH
jgi:hypothetical protein